MKQRNNSRREANTQNAKVGELRASQALSPYGVGSVVDLPKLSVMVMGLDDWPKTETVALRIEEPRLLRVVQIELPSVEALRRVPVALASEQGLNNPLDANQHIGIPVRTFPRWLVCPSCRTLARMDSGLFKFEDGKGRPDRARWVHENCQKMRMPPAAVPARFMVACEKGHLNDFPWLWFVRRGQTCTGCQLQLQERGLSGEARDLFVKCETCGNERSMAEAFVRQNMPACTARRPHLRDYDPNDCDVPNVRTVLLGASNLWFPVIYSVIAIPETQDMLLQQVRDTWAHLKDIEEISELKLLQRRGELDRFDDATHEMIFERIQQVRAQLQTSAPASASHKPNEPKDETEQAQHDSLKAPEWQVFSQPDAALRTDDFQLRRVTVPAPYASHLSQVVLVERMREVRALAGFTRIDAPGEIADLDTETVGVQLTALSKSAPRWVPAAELRGEGIFIQFDEPTVQRWLAKPDVDARNRDFLRAHRNWRQARQLSDLDRGFPGLRYVLLHSFAHSLMRQFALDCGYAQASLQERIYAREAAHEDGPMAGVLIYTSATDSEGTLGGLVHLGETIELERYINAALTSAALCSSDPTCAEHVPHQSEVALHGAACHSCMFAPETSCERGNRYLDRTVLVDAITDDGVAFFA